MTDVEAKDEIRIVFVKNLVSSNVAVDSLSSLLSIAGSKCILHDGDALLDAVAIHVCVGHFVGFQFYTKVYVSVVLVICRARTE